MSGDCTHPNKEATEITLTLRGQTAAQQREALWCPDCKRWLYRHVAFLDGLRRISEPEAEALNREAIDRYRKEQELYLLERDEAGP